MEDVADLYMSTLKSVRSGREYLNPHVISLLTERKKRRSGVIIGLSVGLSVFAILGATAVVLMKDWMKK